MECLGTVARPDPDPGAVFEDRRARPGDMDGDGNAAFVVESALIPGAALAICRRDHGRLAQGASTPPVGRASR